MVKGVGQVQLRIVMPIFQVDQRFGIDSRVQFRHLQEGMDLAMVCMVIIPGIDLQMSHLLKTCKLILRGHVALLVMAVPPKDLSYQAAVQTLLVNRVKAALADCS